MYRIKKPHPKWIRGDPFIPEKNLCPKYASLKDYYELIDRGYSNKDEIMVWLWGGKKGLGFSQFIRLEYRGTLGNYFLYMKYIYPLRKTRNRMISIINNWNDHRQKANGAWRTYHGEIGKLDADFYGAVSESVNAKIRDETDRHFAWIEIPKEKAELLRIRITDSSANRSSVLRVSRRENT